MPSKASGPPSAARVRIAVPIVLGLMGFAVILVLPAAGATTRGVSAASPAWSIGCDVPPRSFDEITDLIQIGRSSQGASASPAANSSKRDATLDEIRTVLTQFVVCSGAGEPLRVWSLYTDAYLARLLSRERGYDRVRYDLDAEPRPLAKRDWPRIIAFERGHADGSGRIVADATIYYPNLDRSKHLRFWFVWQDDRLRIDEVDGEITFAVP